VRVTLGCLRIKTDLGQSRLDQPPALGGIRRQTVHLQPLFDDLRDREPRREARKRVLKDHLHLAPQWPQLALAECRDIVLSKADMPSRLGQPQQCEAECRFARAALADDAEGCALAHRKRDAVDRLDVAPDPAQHAAADREPHPEVVRRHQLRSGGVCRWRPALRLGGEQASRKRVPRVGENGGGRAGLYDLAPRHDADLVRHLADNRQIVGDQQQRHPEALSQIPQEL